MPKTSSIRPVVSIQYRLVTERRTRDDSTHRAIIASRGENGASNQPPDETSTCRGWCVDCASGRWDWRSSTTLVCDVPARPGESSGGRAPAVQERGWCSGAAGRRRRRVDAGDCRAAPAADWPSATSASTSAATPEDDRPTWPADTHTHSTYIAESLACTDTIINYTF